MTAVWGTSRPLKQGRSYPVKSPRQCVCAAATCGYALYVADVAPEQRQGLNDPTERLEFGRFLLLSGAGPHPRQKAYRNRVRLADSATQEQLVIRIDHEVFADFRSSGTFWQTRMSDALKDWLKTHSAV